MPFFYTHYVLLVQSLNCGLTLPHILILALSLYTLELLSYPSKRWDSDPIFIHIGILTSSFETKEFWPCLYTHYILSSDLIVLTLELWSYLLTLVFWSYPLKKPSDSGPISLNIGIMMLSLRTLDFLPHFYRNSDRILPNIGIRILTFQTIQSGPSSIRIGIMFLFFRTLVFWSCFYTHWNFDLMLRNIEFWPYSYKHLGISCPRPSTAIIGTVALSLQTF